jgi:dTDP-4-amino-4,6-dideoxygalactose transaminase
MDPIMDIARRHGLKVIEDAAQAMGASYKAKKVCTFGDIGCISFFPSKNLGCFGDGGMVVTGDEELWKRMKMIGSHGSRQRYYHEMLGVNSRLDTIQAAILMVKLRHLEEYNSLRQTAASRYDALLKGAPVATPYIEPKCQHIFHQYTLRVPDRDALAAHLKEKGIPHAVYYPVPLHLQQAFAASGNSKGDFPVTEKAADEVISLPMHTELTEEQQSMITGVIQDFYRDHRNA